jgi:lipoprotein-anchoring transpeptidase ErfK/SrfK
LNNHLNGGYTLPGDRSHATVGMRQHERHLYLRRLAVGFMGLVRFTRESAAAVTLLALAPLLLSSCTSSPKQSEPTFVTSPSAGPSASPPAAALALEITPAAQAKNLPISAEIGTKVTGGTVQSVTLKDSAGTNVAGRLRADASAWVPDRPLKYKRSYTATVVATSAGGQSVTQTTSFSTMSEPARHVGTGLYLSADREYGVAMPVVVEFTSDIAPSARAGVQSRLFVSTNPPQPGVWHWTGPRQVLYRAPQFWQPGTTITVRAALQGHPMGGGRYGDTDRRAVGHISKDKIVIVVENSTKKMSFYKNDQLIKTLPVSLGKKSTPSSSGTMVIMDKQEKTVFDTTNDPKATDRYRVNIEYAQRLTWNGEFIHAAPWSVQHQGKRNVSHGCVNVSMGNAQWLYSQTHIGDPVTIRGTERQLVSGNGFTAWDLSWADYIKGSALPVPPELAAAGDTLTTPASPSPDTSASSAPSPLATQ